MYQRIVSLTPSITETLFAIGAGHRVVGVTDACDYPPEVNDIPHVCAWFEPDMDRIQSLSPDLVLGLESAHSALVPVLQSLQIRFEQVNPTTVSEVLDDINRIGRILEAGSRTDKVLKRLDQRLDKLARKLDSIQPERRLRVSRVLEIDADHLMIAGPHSFQYDVITRAGGINISTGLEAAYPKVSFEQFKAWDPDVVFICGSDPHRVPNLQADPRWQTLSSVSRNRLYQFHCGLTCRTGPRIVDMAELLFQTLYETTGDV